MREDFDQQIFFMFSLYYESLLNRKFCFDLSDRPFDYPMYGCLLSSSASSLSTCNMEHAMESPILIESSLVCLHQDILMLLSQENFHTRYFQLQSSFLYESIGSSLDQLLVRHCWHNCFAYRLSAIRIPLSFSYHS